MQKEAFSQVYLYIKLQSTSSCEKQKGIEIDKLKAKVVKSDNEDKLTTLKLYRRKNGLCFKCGEKWGPSHKRPAQVSIHVLEELLDAVDEEFDDPQHRNCEPSGCETVMAVGTDQTKQSST